MTDTEFNALLNGPLNHPMMMFRLLRLGLALRHVVEATGKIGADALREHCRGREEHDERRAEEF